MDKKTLIDKISNDEYTKEKLISWVGSLQIGTRKPDHFKKGDVFMHPIFRHPYILLRKYNNEWLCTLITSDTECSEILEPCESRFYSNNFITKILFTVAEPIGTFHNVYDNKSQVKSILKKLIDNFSKF